MAKSGQTTVTTAGTAVRLGSQEVNGPVWIKAVPANTGVMYIGNDGAEDVTSSNGFPLSANELVEVWVDNLNQLWVDSTVNGEKVAWLLETP